MRNNMVLYNAATKELTAKVVYYGPGLGGKTTNLQLLHDRLEPDTVGKLLTLPTQTDRTVSFDLLPVDLGEIKGYKIRFQLATVPGRAGLNVARKAGLRGADGVVFVADSRRTMLTRNQESWQNLKDNLGEIGLSFEAIPIVVQYNKRDLSDILPVDAMQESLGLSSYPFIEAVASAGRGVTETFKLISKLTFVDLLRRLQARKPEEAAELVAAARSASELAVGSGPSEPLTAQGFAAPAEEAPAPAPAEPARTADLERLAAAEARIAAIEERLASEAGEHRAAEPAAETTDRLAAFEARVAAIEERIASEAAERRPAESAAETPEMPAPAEERLAAIEERFTNEAGERRRLADAAAETAGKLAAAEGRAAAIEERLASEAGERRRLADAAAETAARLAAAEARIEEGEGARRTAQQAAEAVLAGLSVRAENLSREIAELARQVGALETGLQERTARGQREAEEIRSQIAPLLEAHAEKSVSERQALAELDRLRDSLADSLAEFSDRLRRAVPEV